MTTKQQVMRVAVAALGLLGPAAATLSADSSPQAPNRLVSRGLALPENGPFAHEVIVNEAARYWDMNGEHEGGRENRARLPLERGALKRVESRREFEADKFDGEPSTATPRVDMAREASGYDHRKLQTTCSEGESFYITFPSGASFEGCYEATFYLFNDEIVYSTGEGTADGDTVVMAYLHNLQDVGDQTLWTLGYVSGESTSAGALTVYSACITIEEAATVHPADGTWYCAFDTTGYYLMPEDEFSADCGCTGLTVPSTDAPMATPVTAAPMAVSETPAPIALVHGSTSSPMPIEVIGEVDSTGSAGKAATLSVGAVCIVAVAALWTLLM